MSKRLLTIIIASALVGGFFGSLISAQLADANIIDDFLNLFTKLRVEQQVSPSTPEPVELYKPALDYEEAVIRAVERAEPSVVSIVVTKDLPIIERCSYDPFGDLPPGFQDFFGSRGFEFFQPCERGTERREVGGGTGFIVSVDGMILTNKHVVADAGAEYTVLTNDGKKHDAEVLARDPVQDLAIIKIDPPADGFIPAVLGDSDAIKLGQTAIAIGNSLGELRNTVSVGVISGLARTITASGQRGAETLQGVVQTDAAINPGNSGGPLLNLKGEVIGVNTALAVGAQNIGFAIPINQAKRDIDSVERTGSIKVPYLGVRYFTITPEFAEEQNVTFDYGALIRGGDDGPGVIPDSPASRAGLMAEDIILEIQNVRVNKDNPLGLLIQKYNIGDTILIKVRRGGEIVTLSVTLEERPDL
ncbi:MAG: trypsin-like peptidase domain-containing protein [Patescibacteria group bacterium]|nr:trypsin-like peptidase domain-containing protein [Patescibacteria group bacterium]